MSTTTIKIRGQEYDVEYTDKGYEPDTNAHEIDWHFPFEKPEGELTDEEADSIEEQIYKRCSEGGPYFPDDVI